MYVIYTVLCYTMLSEYTRSADMDQQKIKVQSIVYQG